MKIAILGTGNIGTQLCKKLSVSNTIYFGSRNPQSEKLLQLVDEKHIFAMSHTEAINSAEVVIIALHPPHIKQLIDSQSLDLSDKVVIDCSNQIFENISPEFESATYALKSLTKCASIVKAFNTTGSENIALTKDGMIDTYIAGEEIAKNSAFELSHQIGFNPVDAGGLENTHALEELARIWITICRQNGNFSSYFKLVSN